jgi:N-hydroxyarylamine O-acetyltransferase
VSHRLDLAAYFRRIDYAGPLEPTLETLNGIVSAHVQHIPFENLDVLLGRGISIEPADVERKLVREHRGGYCFEQNTLLLHMLEALGFSVTPLSARVRVGRPLREFTPPRTHLFLRVDIERESFLADVGVGGFSLACAIRLAIDVELETPHESRRLVCEGTWHGLGLRSPDARIFHQVYYADTWNDVYDFTLEPMPAVDRVVANWYTSAHPVSHFRDRLVAARATTDGRIGLLNRTLTRRYNDGRAETLQIETKTQLMQTLAEHFGIKIEPPARFGVAELDELEP